MIGKAISWVKSHVWLAVGLVVGVIVLSRMGSSPASGGSTVVSAQDPTAVQVGAQLQALQIQAQSEAAKTQAQLEAVEDTNATQLALGGIMALLSQRQTESDAAVAIRQIDAAAATTQQQNSLAAAVAAQTIQSQENIAAYQAATLASINASNVEVQKLLISSNAATAQLQVKASKDVATQSWWDKLF